MRTRPSETGIPDDVALISPGWSLPRPSGFWHESARELTKTGIMTSHHLFDVLSETYPPPHALRFLLQSFCVCRCLPLCLSPSPSLFSMHWFEASVGFSYLQVVLPPGRGFCLILLVRRQIFCTCRGQSSTSGSYTPAPTPGVTNPRTSGTKDHTIVQTESLR